MLSVIIGWKSFFNGVRAVRAGLLGLLAFGTCLGVQAHGYDAGDVRIEHPYATPSKPGEHSIQVYFRALTNRGQRPDKLVSARTPLAQDIAFERMDSAQGVQRKTALAAIDIPAHADVPTRHNSPNGYTLTLTGLPRPLPAGERFSLWLRFEKGGEVEVKVVVQQPKDAPTPTHAHAH
jgi:periplasmic copper chaperone A